ncbi:LexA family transcriptional regulator [Alicyclobacillaceae bacterium I2511]|nr:LexA family transcriptional regulator [Alicyclobacillaceae bacterium I2511]
MNFFAQRLRLLREARGLSQEQLSTHTSIPRSTLTHYEREVNERLPRRERLEQIADFFGCTVDYLLGREQVASPRPKEPEGDPEHLTENFKRLHQSIDNPYLLESIEPGGTQYPDYPLIQISVVSTLRCGPPWWLEGDVIGSMPLSGLPWENDHQYVWYTVPDSSMAGTNMYEGSIVLIQITPKIENGDIAVTCIDENVVIRRVIFAGDTVALMADNLNIAPVTRLKNNLTVIGKVEGIFTLLHHR